MSSVQSFIRQIPVSAKYYNAAAVVSGAASLAFEFVPTSGNYVGNYPPGYVQNSAALAAAIAAASAASSGAVVLRDMGKTIETVVGAAGVAIGFYRQVQLIAPASVSSFIGGPTGSTFGVLGAPLTPDNYTNYLTFYIPVTVSGVAGSGASSTAAYALIGGAM